MSEAINSPAEAGTPNAAKSGQNHNGKPLPKPRGPSIHQIYALPIPIRTFPLPAFYPNNPISILHIAYAWLKQTLRPPPAEPALVYHGMWSETTTAIHVTDEKSMRALWEQGFFGKGSLSRSEPNWLKRELVLRGLEETHVSEILTAQRREERAQSKWERARLEQEAIRNTRLQELEKATGPAEDASNVVVRETNINIPKPPIGPAELLALPNSTLAPASPPTTPVKRSSILLNGGAESLVPPKYSLIEQLAGVGPVDAPIGELSPALDIGLSTGSAPPDSPASDDRDMSHSPSQDVDTNGSGKGLRKQKSVRFSPKVESTTFGLSDPPSPSASLESKRAGENGVTPIPDGHVEETPGFDASNVVNKEHLQLTTQEAFFLSFGLGALAVTDPYSGLQLSVKEMLQLFREHSYYPPRNGPDAPDLQPDDHFLVHYAVYHHFRSLGWVPRAGIKFGVDWLLYTRGPVFDHAEFGLIIIPSYSDQWWKDCGKKQTEKPWHWLHSVVRVLSHATKSLVLVYVDVPSAPAFDAAMESGIAEALRLYKVREVMVKRWSSNRNR